MVLKAAISNEYRMMWREGNIDAIPANILSLLAESYGHEKGQNVKGIEVKKAKKKEVTEDDGA